MFVNLINHRDQRKPMETLVDNNWWHWQLCQSLVTFNLVIHLLPWKHCQSLVIFDLVSHLFMTFQSFIYTLKRLSVISPILSCQLFIYIPLKVCQSLVTFNLVSHSLRYHWKLASHWSHLTLSVIHVNTLENLSVICHILPVSHSFTYPWKFVSHWSHLTMSVIYLYPWKFVSHWSHLTLSVICWKHCQLFLHTPWKVPFISHINLVSHLLHLKLCQYWFTLKTLL
jgi:hypothetical protein